MSSGQVPERELTNAIPVPDSGSFRDRNNRVYHLGNTIIRGLSHEAEANWKALSSLPFFLTFLAESKVVASELLPPGSVPLPRNDETRWAAYLAHERIPFISYPYEWSFGMLKDAALLQLELVERAIESGWTMKDATAYNIQWIGCRPVFIDLPSFEPYTRGSPWRGYRQFCMMYLYPLMLQAYRGVDFQSLLRSELEGIDPLYASRLLSGASILRKGVLSHVYLHAKMQARYSQTELAEAKLLTENAGNELRPARHTHHSEAMVLGTLQGLRRIVQSLTTLSSRTTWSNYDADHSYGEQSFDVKKAFVENVISARRRHVVWDLGCNTGTFSRICALNADYVVSVDGDPKAIDRFYYGQKSAEQINILPLTMNLANISPGQGWLGTERKAFDQRGKPELILCLALIHHIVISANIPLSEFLAWLRQLDAEVIVELVSIEDDMSRMLLRNRVNQYHDLTEAGFETALAPLFSIRASQHLKGGHRKLYHLEPRLA